VGNKPILFYALEDMVAAGITDIGVIIGETGPEVVDAVGDGSTFGAKVTYLPQEEPLGLAHCVRIAADYLGDDDFVMYLGDNLLQQDLSEVVAEFEHRCSPTEPSLLADQESAAAMILLAQVPDPHRFGVAEFDPAGRVVRLVEKPADPPSDMALVGVYLFTPAIHQAVAAIEPSARGELEITDAIQWLIDHGHRVHHDVVRGWWLDTGKKDSLLESNRRVLEILEPRIDGSVDAESTIEGRVVVEEGAVVVASHVRGPAIIGAGARVERSYVGPFTAIAADCRLSDCEVEHSVLLERAAIEGVSRLTDSLIGRDTTVRRSGARPAATRLLIGDDCSIELQA
jgi:glucose-1-phosphate thymidylyltransferase